MEGNLKQGEEFNFRFRSFGYRSPSHAPILSHESTEQTVEEAKGAEGCLAELQQPMPRQIRGQFQAPVGGCGHRRGQSPGVRQQSRRKACLSL